MKGIILAAGRGNRMGGLTEKKHKSQIIFHRKPLIEWQLSALKSSGIKEIAIVTGYLANTFKYKTFYFHNSRWFETNMVYSLLQAEKWLEKEECIISYSDIVYSSKAVKKLMLCNDNIAITYDPQWQKLWEQRFDNIFSDAESFQINSDNILTDIGRKCKSISEIQGQYMGLIKLKPQGWSSIKEYLSKQSEKNIDNLDITEVLYNLIKRKISITATAIDDLWYEFDSEKDLYIYENCRNNPKIFL